MCFDLVCVEEGGGQGAKKLKEGALATLSL